jgi:hypothetical protein
MLCVPTEGRKFDGTSTEGTKVPSEVPNVIGELRGSVALGSVSACHCLGTGHCLDSGATECHSLPLPCPPGPRTLPSATQGPPGGGGTPPGVGGYPARGGGVPRQGGGGTTPVGGDTPPVGGGTPSVGGGTPPPAWPAVPVAVAVPLAVTCCKSRRTTPDCYFTEKPSSLAGRRRSGDGKQQVPLRKQQCTALRVRLELHSSGCQRRMRQKKHAHIYFIFSRRAIHPPGARVSFRRIKKGCIRDQGGKEEEAVFAHT